MPNDNTSLDLLAAYLGKKPVHLFSNRLFRNAVINIAQSQSGGGGGAVSSVFGRTGDIVATSGDYTFTQIGSTPTTVSGYGITDALTNASNLAWSKITGTPTSISGYGIADGVTLTGVQTLTNKTLTSPSIGALSNLTGNGFVKTSGGVGTLSIDTNTYLTANQSITLSGDVSGSGTTAITTAIGANKVTLGQMATLAAGKVIGQSGVTTATPGAVNVPILIASGTASAQTSISINLSTFNTIYTCFLIELDGFVTASSGANLQLQVSVDGTTYDAGAGNYRWSLAFSNDSPTNGNDGNTSTTAIGLNTTATGLSNTAGDSYNGTIKVFNVGNSALFPYIKYESTYSNPAGNSISASGNGKRTAAQVTKGIKILSSTGNITSGTYRVYGLF